MSTEPPPKCTSNIKVALLKAFAIVPQGERAAAMRLAAEVLAENSQQPRPITEEDCYDILASPVPRPFSIGTTLPQSLRVIIDETAGLFTEQPRRSLTESKLVETAEEREDREKHLILPGGLKVLRFAAEPYSAFYPHLWMGHNIESWLRVWEKFLAGHQIPDIHTLKLRRLESGIKAWFQLIEGSRELTGPQVAIFYSLIDPLIEVMLLIKCQGRPAVTTLTFAAAVECRRHANKPLDYFADISTARVATEAPKCFRF